MLACEHCQTSLIKAQGLKYKLRIKGLIAFRIDDGSVKCETVCPTCSLDTEIDLTLGEATLKGLLAPRSVTFYVRPPQPSLQSIPVASERGRDNKG